jgi:predicted lipoprotein with Yx(FWY)xxD motif
MKTTMAMAGAAIIILSLSATAAVAQISVPAKVGDTTKGKALVDEHGMTLYTFDRDDTPGKSNCSGKCAQNWPPLAAATDAVNSNDWTVIVRNDGSKQWAYKGKPLYKWMSDKRPGDVDGDGRNNVWHIAVP